MVWGKLISVTEEENAEQGKEDRDCGRKCSIKHKSQQGSHWEGEIEYLKEVKELFLAEESEQRAYKGVGL